MTPKEKAEKLTMEFIMGTHSYDIHYGVNREIAKQCALIAVDEILKAIGYNIELDNKVDCYWVDVKNEINNL